MDHPRNPYLDARREWQERYGSYIKRESAWRLVATVAVCTSLLLGIGLYKVKADQRVLTYVVEVDAHGDVTNTRRVDAGAKPNEKHIRAQVVEWLTGARTVYVDAKAIRHANDRTYGSTLPASAANRALDQFFSSDSPYARAAKETVDVAVRSAMPLTDDTWRIEWDETIRQRSGKLVSTKSWQATVNVTIATPTTPEQVLANPFGVFVTQFSWAPRL